MSDEHAEQAALFDWATRQQARYPQLALLHATLNGLYTSPNQARRAKEAGMRRGVPDICLPLARRGYHGLWIELKTATGRLTPEQREWLAMLSAAGYRAVMCRGWPAAMTEIEAYLADD